MDAACQTTLAQGLKTAISILQALVASIKERVYKTETDCVKQKIDSENTRRGTGQVERQYYNEAATIPIPHTTTPNIRNQLPFTYMTTSSGPSNHSHECTRYMLICHRLTIDPAIRR
jgi:hypothetical protein